jgi:hypothetical protein
VNRWIASLSIVHYQARLERKAKKNKKQRSRALSAARELSYTIVEMKDFSVNIPCRILLQPEILGKKVSNVTQKPLHS